jgi:glycosyltransferase involved in cell wall biosynthesis
MDMLDHETDEVIVAGNDKSPHEDIVRFLDGETDRTGVLTTYLAPDDHRVKETNIWPFIPGNHTARRNFALLEAIKRKTDVLVTIDDDNYPYKPMWLEGVHNLLDPKIRHHRPVIASPQGWWNAGKLCSPKIIHRGYPVTRWTEIDDSMAAPCGDRHQQVGVVASLWYGDPDINATERMVCNPNIVHVKGAVVLELGTWCPFDSQSTAVHGALAHMMFMWPDLGRYDDIWSSYLMRAVMDVTGWYVTYGTPAVSQDRNPHNLIRDLKDELFGYEYTEEFTDFLRELVQDAPMSFITEVEAYRWFMIQTATYYRRLSAVTRESLHAWLRDLKTVGA